MAHQAPLKYIFYIAATPEKVWEGFVSRESNRIIFSGARCRSFERGRAIGTCQRGWELRQARGQSKRAGFIVDDTGRDGGAGECVEVAKEGEKDLRGFHKPIWGGRSSL